MANSNTHPPTPPLPHTPPKLTHGRHLQHGLPKLDSASVFECQTELYGASIKATVGQALYLTLDVVCSKHRLLQLHLRRGGVWVEGCEWSVRWDGMV